MRTGAPPMSEAQPSPADDSVPYGSQLTVRALDDPDGAALTVVARDGTATTSTWSGLERVANQWARTLLAS